MMSGTFSGKRYGEKLRVSHTVTGMKAVWNGNEDRSTLESAVGLSMVRRGGPLRGEKTIQASVRTVGDGWGRSVIVGQTRGFQETK